MPTNNNPIKYSDLINPDSSVTDLIKQLEELEETYSKTLRTIKAEAIQVTSSMQGVSGATEQGRKSIAGAASDADRLARAQKELNFAQSEAAAELARINKAKQEANRINKLVIKANESEEGSYNKLSARYSLNKIALNQMSAEMRKNTKEGQNLERETRAIYEEMKRLQEATGKFTLNVGNYTQASDEIRSYSDKVLQSIGINKQFSDAVIALGKGGQEARAAFSAMSDGASALGKTLLGFMANPAFLAIAGIAGAGVAFKWWYDYNAGLQEATKLTADFTQKSGADLKAVRNEILAIANTFNVDFKETLSAVDSLVAQFGISFEEALGIVKDGFVAGADAQGNFLNNLQQFAPQLREIGLTAQEATALIAQTQSGIFSEDGLAAIQQASDRIRRMNSTTANSLKAIGIDAQQVSKDLEAGTISIFDVIQQVSQRLSELPQNSQEVGNALRDVFGKQGVKAGLAQIESLKDISDNLDEVKGKTGELGRLQEEQANAQAELQNALSALFDQTGGNFEKLTTKVKLFATNAMTLVIRKVVDLVNEVINLYNKSVVFRALIQGVGTQVKTLFDFVVNQVRGVIDVFQGLGKVVKGVFTFDVGEIAKGVLQATTAIPRVLTNTMRDAAQNIRDGITNINKTIEPIKVPVLVGGDATNKRAAVQGEQPTPTSGGGAKGGKSGTSAADLAKKQAQEQERAYQETIKITRKLEDERLKIETDIWKKQTLQITYQYNRQIEDIRHTLATRKDLTIEQTQQLNETIQVLEQQQTEALLNIERNRQIKELEYLKESISLRLAAVREGSEEERQLKLEQIKAEQDLEILRNYQKPAEQQQATTDIIGKYDKQRSGLADEYLQAQLAIFDKQQELAQSEFDLLKNSEERKTQFRLKAEKARLQKILELNKMAGTKLSDVEVQTINNTIAKIDQEIKQSKGKERSTDLYGLFGLNLSDEQKEAINTSVSFAMESLNTYLEAMTAAADKKVENAQREVDSAQRALEAEIQARNAGYANNVEIARKELDNAKQNQQKALKEQQRAQKQQAAIQALEQVANLVTGSTLIWKQLGYPWAIPAIAVMWGSFAASKIKAAQLVSRNTEQYREGTVEYLEGGSHQSGNDVDLGTKPDGTRRRAEGGEFFAVINKRNSRKYRRYIPDIIHSLNNGEFEKKYMKAYSGADNIMLNVQNASTMEIEDLKGDVKAIKEQNARKYYTDANGNMVTEYKNLKQVIKK